MGVQGRKLYLNNHENKLKFKKKNMFYILTFVGLNLNTIVFFCCSQNQPKYEMLVNTYTAKS